MWTGVLLTAFVILVLIGVPIAFLIVTVIAVVRIRAYVLRQMAKDRREKELREWARGNGFAYSATEALMKFRCQPFECLQKGDHCCYYNIIEGTSANHRWRAFDYYYHSYYEGSLSDDDPRPLISWLIGTSKGDRHFSAVVIDAGIPLLPLTIRPRDMLDEVAELIGFEEIGFESAEFSQKFFVRSADRRWAYDVVHQKTMEILLAHPHFLLDFQGSQIIAYHHDKVFSLGEFESALKVVTGIVDGLPESVVRDLKGIDSGGVLS
jgi:hypothetical protein